MLETSIQKVLATIKNAVSQGFCECSLKNSAINVSILKSLKHSGLIRGFEHKDNSGKLTLFLKFGPHYTPSLSSYVGVSSIKRKRLLSYKLSKSLFKNFNLACVPSKKRLGLYGSLNSVPHLRANCAALIK